MCCPTGSYILQSTAPGAIVRRDESRSPWALRALTHVTGPEVARSGRFFGTAELRRNARYRPRVFDYSIGTYSDIGRMGCAPSGSLLHETTASGGKN